jgi:tryptophan halogenase
LKKKIVIVGGGSAGWLSALYVNKIYNGDVDIILIESEDIGILGAGEGSVPSFVAFLIQLGIDETEFLNYTNGTHKIGVHFDNWNGDGDTYLHDFFSTDLKTNKGASLEHMGYVFKNEFDFNEYMLSKDMAYKNLSPIGTDGKEIVNHSFHFDARLAAEYLRKVAEHRGVKRIEGIATEFNKDEWGNIKTIKLKDGQSIDNIHFVFDCTGFARKIIGKEYGSEWISYKDKLTVNSAISFQLPQSNNTIEPVTKAVAMKYGWMWQIPLQNRWGCGYIFDNKYINSDEAQKEVEDLLGHTIEVNRTINFDAGRYQSVMIKNCVAIGLSAGFIEPLEATSIGMQVLSLRFISKFDIDYRSSDRIFNYNMLIAHLNDDIADFLQFHYFTKRNDTEFWNYYNKDTNISKTLYPKLDDLKNKLKIKFRGTIFAPESYTMVGLGIKYLDKQKYIERYDIMKKTMPDIDEYFNNLKELREKAKDRFITELDYLKQNRKRINND